MCVGFMLQSSMLRDFMIHDFMLHDDDDEVNNGALGPLLTARVIAKRVAEVVLY